MGTQLGGTHGLLPRTTIVLVVTAVLAYTFLLGPPLFSQTIEKESPLLKLSFEERLAFYLDQNSRQFLRELAVKEKLLLQMIQNITEEVKKRGAEVVSDDQLGYLKIYGEADSLIAEYRNELYSLIGILREVEHLQRVVDQYNDLYSWEALAELRAKVLRVLEDRSLFRKGKYTEARVRSLVHEYNAEVDSVLSLYQRLAKLQRNAAKRNDAHLESAIAAQMDSIHTLMGTYKDARVDSLTDDYMSETSLLAAVLDELKTLQTRALKLDTELGIEIEEIRRSILQNLDTRMLTLLDHPVETSTSPRVSEYLSEWKARQYADFKVHFTKYQIMKRSMLASATPSERTRMLERDLVNAFMNYVDKNYELAEQQFDFVLNDYGEYVESLEAVLFYRGESFFARNLFDDARKDYERIVTEFPDSEYLGDSLFRLLAIHEKFGRLDEFYKYYDYLNSLAHNVEPKCYEKCNYLAGYVYLRDGKLNAAEAALTQVSSDSKYNMTARYLTGLVHINRDDFSQAKDIFKELANRDIYPWTDPKTTFVSNSALLKLGFIHYELGEHYRALQYFNEVSPGFEDFDQALLGAAWSSLKLGDHQQTIAYVSRMFKGYLASNYTYEALVLSAHSKKLLKKRDDALRDLRYVSNARRFLELSDRYNDERRQVLEQLEMLDKLETEILDRRDESLFAITLQIRNELQSMLKQFRSQGAAGSLVLEQYERERQAILDQVAQLDKVISNAYSTGEKDLALKANKQRERLLKTLEVYQADLNIGNINYFSDYPLAAKEGSTKYRKAILNDLSEEADLERRRIQDVIRELETMKQSLETADMDPNAQVALEVLENELDHLRDETSRFHTWVAESQVQEVKTDFDQWADFSGFGMSDITFAHMREREKEILELAENTETISDILEQRKSVLEQRLRDFEREAMRIEEELRQEKIDVERKNKQEYFENLYFDTSEREEKLIERQTSNGQTNSVEMQ